MTLIILIMIALLCLLSAKTRKLGYVLFALLIFVMPLFLSLITVIVFAIHFNNKSKQRKLYEPPTLPRND